MHIQAVNLRGCFLNSAVLALLLQRQRLCVATRTLWTYITSECTTLIFQVLFGGRKVCG
jgi:hypothetical protein